MENGINDHPVISYAVPIDSVERLTGIDFFAAVDDAVEDRIEAQRDPKVWYHEGDPSGKWSRSPPCHVACSTPCRRSTTSATYHHLRHGGEHTAYRQGQCPVPNMDRMHPHHRTST